MFERPREENTTASFPVFAGEAERRVPALLVVADLAHPRLLPATRVMVFEQTLVIGRHPPPPAEGQSIWALRDGCVSAVHAEIRAETGGFELRDLGSRNGTSVDGARIGRSVKLREGAVIFLGLHVAVFRTISGRDLRAIGRELSEPFGPVALASSGFVAVSDRLRRLAGGNGELLLVGETGVGKEVYARAVHEASGRAGRFVAVNCAAIPRELVESELFGFARGAHSEAREHKSGLIDEADGGTLFLDEIGEMSPELQAKLLRFTQDRLVTPVGSTQGRRVNARLLAATNRVELASGGVEGVRLDMAARLGAEPLRLPPLREHIEDLGVLAAHFLRGCERRLHPDAFRAMCLHGWPGNVRELEKTLQEARALSRGADCIDLDHLPRRIAAHHRRAPAS